MQARGKQIGIVGAGIGGLCAAIGLRRAGFDVAVYERAEQIKPLGAGLTLQPNALLALRRMGLGEAIEAAGAPLRAGAVMRWDGSPLMRVPEAAVEQLVRELGAGVLGIHRASLHAQLLRELGADAVKLGRVCAGFSVMGERVRVHFEQGADAVCDALIGADGLHSAVRAQLHGAAPPLYAGYTSFRGVTHDRCGLPDDFGGELWGRGRRFGGCCIDGGRFYWFATLDAQPGQSHATKAEQKAGLLSAFGHFGLHVPALIASTPEADILRTDISDRPPLARWGEGPVTLLGDAAHPMTPNLGQGACQAIEDAYVLTRELSAAASVREGLARYERARLARANAVVVTARRLGAIGQWQNPLACWLRDGLFRALPASLTLRQMRDAWRLPAPSAP